MRQRIRRLADALSVSHARVIEKPVVERTEAAIRAAVDPLKPAPALLAKLGFIAVRTCAMLKEPDAQFERMALERLLDDHEVKAWLESMAEHSYIPRRTT